MRRGAGARGLLWTAGTSCDPLRSTRRCFNNSTACHSRVPSRQSSETKHAGRGHADRGVGLNQEFQAEGPSESGGHPSGGGLDAPADFRGEKRLNETHRNTTDPDARLYRKGPGMEAKLCFIGHGPMENRSGLILGSSPRTDTRLTRVLGHAERLAALDTVQHVAEHPCAITLGADWVTMPPISSRDCAV